MKTMFFVLFVILFTFIISLFAQGTITSVVPTSSSYSDFDDVEVRLTANATHSFWIYVSYRPQKNVSGQWIDLDAWDYYQEYTSGSWSVSNKLINIFRGEDYYGNFAPLQVSPAGNGTYRIEVVMYVDFNSEVTGYSSSFSVQDVQAPAAPTGLTRSIVNPPTNNPKISWTRNLEGDVEEYEVWKKRGSGNWNLHTITNATYYIDTGETKAGYLPFQGSIEIYYKVRAVDFNNNASAFSSSVSFNVSGGSDPENFETSDRLKIDVHQYITSSIIEIPKNFILYQNYPNPFNSNTNIMFSLPKTSSVELNIYTSTTGQRVIQLINKQLENGFYTISWDGRDVNGNSVASGLYIYELLTDGKRFVKKMFLMK